MTVELNGWSLERVKGSTGEVYLRSRAKNSREAGIIRGSRGKKMKGALVAVTLFSVLLAAIFPTAHGSWLKWHVGLGTTAISGDLVEAKALIQEACGDNSHWGQLLCQNANIILISLERRAS